MTYKDDAQCAVKWQCNKLNSIVTVDLDAIYDMKNGWLCECGDWIKTTTKDHIVLKLGRRTAYITDKNVKVTYINQEPVSRKKVRGRCTECGKETLRTILGVSVCYDCYSGDYKDYPEDYDLNKKEDDKKDDKAKNKSLPLHEWM